jgi:putative phage-type endonuclease
MIITTGEGNMLTASQKRVWLQKRKKGIGGSELAAIIGLSPFAGPIDIWKNKRDEGEKFTPTEPMRWGNLLEYSIAKEWNKRSGGHPMVGGDLIVHSDESWMRGTPDFLLFENGIHDGPTSVLEVKNTSVFAKGYWGSDKDPKVPVNYVIQGQWYLHLTGLDTIHYGVLCGGNELISRTLYRDDELINELMNRGREFWRLVETGIEPDELETKEMDGKVVNVVSAGPWDKYM